MSEPIPSIETLTSSGRVAREAPLDEISRVALAERGLEVRFAEGEAALGAWVDAVGRGFLEGRRTPERRADMIANVTGARVTGVYDPAGPHPEVPVATVDSWVTDLTVDVDRAIPLWAISALTVSPTHRRRGIARAMVMGELRAAASTGVPVAGLTVSETTIYGRYGFAPALDVAGVRIDTRRAGWAGPPAPEGLRLDHIETEEAYSDLLALFERARRRTPGEVVFAGRHLRWVTAMDEGNPMADSVRAVRCTDLDGARQGVVIYRIEGGEGGGPATLQVRALVAETPAAYAALWRFVVEHDLVGTVTASELSLEEPLRWLVADSRALTWSRTDLHWLRILDVPACLGARTYRAPGAVTLRVSDPLGFAQGEWRLTVARTGAVGIVEVHDGVARAGGSGVGADGAGEQGGEVELDVAALSALLLGGVRATTLAAAGRLVADSATAAWMDEAFAPAATPRLSFWY